jgi:flagellar hook-length control protein FliK
MTIGPAIPGVPVTGEQVALTGGDGAAGGDMFAAIISGMAAALGAEAAEEEGATTPEGEAPPATTDTNPAASVAQLLALTARQQGKAKLNGEGGDQPEESQGHCELPVITLGEETPEALPPASPIVPNAPQQPTVATIEGGASKPALVAPQSTSPGNEIQRKVAELAKALIAKPEAEEAAPKTVASSQIADMLKAVTKPMLLANGKHAPAQPTAKADEPSPTAAPEARSLVQAAISATAPSTLAALEGTRSLDAPQELLPVEPKLDASEFAIERQLDVSAEGEWLDSLAKDIARTAGEGGTLRFKLNPENLGSLRVEITPQANGSVIRLTADTDAARAIIADAQTKLVAEARANGVRISETHVDLGGQHQSGDPRRQNAAFEEAPIRTARFLREDVESDGKPTRSQSERYA